jgi:hypothetical protein
LGLLDLLRLLDLRLRGPDRLCGRRLTHNGSAGRGLAVGVTARTVTRGGARIESVRGHADSEKDTVFTALVAVQRSKKRADLANYRIRALPRPYFVRDASATVAHRARIAICATLFTRCVMGCGADRRSRRALAQ